MPLIWKACLLSNFKFSIRSNLALFSGPWWSSVVVFSLTMASHTLGIVSSKCHAHDVGHTYRYMAAEWGSWDSTSGFTDSNVHFLNNNIQNFSWGVWGLRLLGEIWAKIKFYAQKANTKSLASDQHLKVIPSKQFSVALDTSLCDYVTENWLCKITIIVPSDK